MNMLFISTILFFIFMPALAATTCYYLYNKDNDDDQTYGLKTYRNPLI